MRTILVTGGTSGIGRAIGLAFARDGCRVTVTGRTQAEADAFDADGSDAAALALDVANTDAVAALCDKFERLDVLVNCAGIILREGKEHDPENFARVLDVNLTGTMRMCHACRPRLAESNGSVINIASMLTFFGSGFVPAYASQNRG